MNLAQYKYIYFIGIGGIGMSALARYFNIKGFKVFGYDRLKSNLCSELIKEGVDIHYTAAIENIPKCILNSSKENVLVIYTPAVSFDNHELKYFQKKGYRLYKRAEVLGMISSQMYTIAIAGTHGKTTTSTILSHILHSSGKNITAFFGGVSKDYNSNFLFSEDSEYLIVEADEYDRSFLFLEPDVVIITSVELDHMDIYDNKEDIEHAFQEFVHQIKEDGMLFLESSVDLHFTTKNNIQTLNYSAKSEANFFSSDINYNSGLTYFDISILNVPFIDDQKFSVELMLPGRHNISNAIAAISVSLYLGLASKKIITSLRMFSGIKRRFDIVINNEQLVFIDDYAHHPKEVSCTINTIKQLFPERNITVVFQPHLFSRTKDLMNEFAYSLSLADKLILLDIYPAREKPIVGVNSKMLLELCTNLQKETCSKDELIRILKKEELDVLLTLGAGDIGDLVKPIKYALN